MAKMASSVEHEVVIYQARGGKRFLSPYPLSVISWLPAKRNW